ncbi:B12-binding domain-containing radical SAM protein [Thermodesulfobacteriota bacterium]
MRVLLINSNTKSDLLAAPPLGLAYVAEATRRAGHEVRLVDPCFSRRGNGREPEDTIAGFSPEIIGVSIRNIDNVNMLHPISYVPDVLELCRRIRRVTDVTMVLGGSGTGIVPEAILRHLEADYVVVSDGETSFPALLNALEKGEPAAGIPGVGYIVDGEFNLVPPELIGFPEQRPDLGKWVDMKPYEKIDANYNIQTKRGCRQRCIYCTYNQALEGNRMRLRSPVDVVDELEEALFKYHPHTIEFVDSVFNDPLEHSVQILEEIIRRPWKAHLTSMGVNPRNLDSSYLDLMWRAGFRSFMITPESASPTMIANYAKGFTEDDVIRAAEAIGRSSFAAWWFFMIGGPGETNETLQESLDFALKYLLKKGRPVTNIAHYFLGVRVYPGTRLWQIAGDEGLVSPNTDPLDPVWYLSEKLSLERAVEQMNEAAATAPEIYLGYDERVLGFSRISAFLFDLLRLPRPYWRYFRVANLMGLKTGIRFMYRPPDVPGMLRDSLLRQGYTGPLLGQGA